ncbi:MAG: PEP-CTERM sorting domain-containing protein [Phycisphaerales bacterium]|nr:PEP-CTERM sorting domain-containing protein [Phycisphaerales bacterium]
MLRRNVQLGLAAVVVTAGASLARAAIVMDSSESSTMADAGPTMSMPDADIHGDSGTGPSTVSASSGDPLVPNPNFSHGAPPSPSNIAFLPGANAQSNASFTVFQGVNSLSLDASGAAGATAQGDDGQTFNAHSESTYTLVFTLTGQSYTYALSGNLSMVFANQFGGNAAAGLTMTPVGGAPSIEDFGAVVPSTPISTSGTLAPGSYVLELSAMADQSYVGAVWIPPHAGAGFDIQFSLTPVPEPGTLCVLAMAGLSLLRRRRNRR